MEKNGQKIGPNFVNSISQSILRGLIFRDDQNEWQQHHVSSKTAQYHQSLSQFLTDLLETLQ